MSERAGAVLISDRVERHSPNAATIEGELAFQAGNMQQAIEHTSRS
jgi:hypothetical protein